MQRAFTLIEIMFSVGIVAISMIGTLSLLMYIHLENSLEQERARAHQIVCQTIEDVQTNLATLINPNSNPIVWDNGTPDDLTDDTNGTLEIIAKDLNGTKLTYPASAPLMTVEVTISWHPRGPLSAKTMRESAMTYLAP